MMTKPKEAIDPCVYAVPVQMTGTLYVMKVPPCEAHPEGLQEVIALDLEYDLKLEGNSEKQRFVIENINRGKISRDYAAVNTDNGAVKVGARGVKSWAAIAGDLLDAVKMDPPPEAESKIS
jgi:hypothetical protein